MLDAAADARACEKAAQSGGDGVGRGPGKTALGAAPEIKHEMQI